MDYEKDSFSDILAKDARYAPGAYTLLMDVVDYLSEQGGHFNAQEIMDEFRETALDEFGPMTFHVLREWGVKRCEDLGEMMFNLAASRRVARDEEDSKECFVDGYDFREAFLAPYEPR